MKELSIISGRRLKAGSDSGYITGVRCFFKLMRLRPGQFWSTLDYMTWVSGQQKVYSEELKKTHAKPADFWAAFDSWLTKRVARDNYIIYASSDSQHHMPLAALKEWGLPIDDRACTVVWSAPLTSGMDAAAAREDAQRWYSMAAGDVVVLSQGTNRPAWFLDEGGFVEIKGFERTRWGNLDKEEN